MLFFVLLFYFIICIYQLYNVVSSIQLFVVVALEDSLRSLTVAISALISHLRLRSYGDPFGCYGNLFVIFNGFAFARLRSLPYDLPWL